MGTPAEAVQRVFVASYGSDANTATNCGFANPCRGFTAAMTVVDSGGEVVALDAAGYGNVTIAKSVTITANPGFHAGITSSGGSAIFINAPGIDVTLRRLNLTGIGSNNGNGINMTDGASLGIENCVISNFSNRGISATAAANVRVVDSTLTGNFNAILADHGATLDVVNTRMIRNPGAGVLAQASSPGITTSVTVTDSVASGSQFGLYIWTSDLSGTAHTRLVVTRSTVSNNSLYGITAQQDAGTARASVGGSTVTGNATGLQNSGGTFESLGDNLVRQNTTNSNGTITTVSAL
jgi:hypothetical protein